MAGLSTSPVALADLKGGLNAKEINVKNLAGRDFNHNHFRAGFALGHGSGRH